MNDIDEEYGGDTTFTDLGLTIKPTKNNGLFWRNILFENRTGDERTIHSGNKLKTNKIEKWAINCWVRINNDNINGVNYI